MYTVVSPATTPTKPVSNGIAYQNGNNNNIMPLTNGNYEPATVTVNGTTTPNGNA